VVKRAAGFFIQRPVWPEGDTRPWRVRLHERLLAAIRSGELPPGARLPSARQLAAEWGLARGAVDEALDQLQAEGLVQRRVGRGSFVAAGPRRAPAAAVPAARREPNQATLKALERLRTITDDPADFPLHGQRGLHLRPQVGDVSRFPLALWRRCVAAAYHESRREQLSYGPAAGLWELRAAVARHLALTRSMPCHPRQVLIVDSPQHATALVTQVLLEPGSEVCLSDPGHVSTARFFALMHMRTRTAPVDAEGLQIELARERVPHPALVMLQPAHAYPLAGTLSPARRQALLDWAAASGAWVLEHEYMSEIGLDAPVPPPLAAADRHECVLLSGSFSAVMFPSLRMSYLVLPERLAPVFSAVRGMLGDHSPVATQLALARFVDEGHLAAHLRVLRELYRQRRDTLRLALQQHGLAGPRLHRPGGGVCVCLPLPPEQDDRALVAALAARGVAPGALSAHQHERRDLNGLVLGYGHDEPPQIEAAVGVIAQTLHGLRPPPRKPAAR
jgi:GntR family transcriptional regulator/MocR family aminotransferase